MVQNNEMQSKFYKAVREWKPTTAGQKLKRKGAQKKVTKKVQNILASASEDSSDNRAHMTGSSVCATMSSSVDSSLATTVAPNQAGDSAQSFGFQSPVVSQFAHGHLLLWMYLSTLLALHLMILYHLLILKILLKGLHPALVKHHLGWMQEAYFRPSETPGTWFTVGLQFTLHCKQAHVLFSHAPTCIRCTSSRC